MGAKRITARSPAPSVPKRSWPLTQSKMFLQRTSPAQPKANQHQGGLTKPSPQTTSAVLTRPAPEYLAERQGLGFGCLSQAVARLCRMLLETPCFEKRKAVEIPTLTETTPLPQTQTCFAPATDSGLALRRYPAASCQREGARAQQRSLRRGSRQSQKPLAQRQDPPT